MSTRTATEASCSEVYGMEQPRPDQQVRGGRRASAVAAPDVAEDEVEAGRLDGVMEWLTEQPTMDVGGKLVLELDQVFGAFLGQLQQKAALTTILQQSIYTDRFLLFFYNNVKWRGALQRYNYSDLGDEPDKVEIRLPNAGFKYCAAGRAANPPVFRHKCDGCPLTNPMITKLFPTILRATQSSYDTAFIYYNSERKRLDIKLMPKNGSGMPVLGVHFEEGYPEFEDRRSDRVSSTCGCAA